MLTPAGPDRLWLGSPSRSTSRKPGVRHPRAFLFVGSFAQWASVVLMGASEYLSRPGADVLIARCAGIVIVVMGLAAALAMDRRWIAGATVSSIASTGALLHAVVHYVNIMHRDPAASFYLQDEFAAALVAAVLAVALSVWMIMFRPAAQR